MRWAQMLYLLIASVLWPPYSERAEGILEGKRAQLSLDATRLGCHFRRAALCGRSKPWRLHSTGDRM